MAVDDDILFDRVLKLTVLSETIPLNDEEFKSEEKPIGIEIENRGGVGQRVEFEVERNLTKNPNKCRIKITNLNENSRSAFKSSPIGIQLDAGYRTNSALVFSGNVSFAVSTLEGPNWVTEMECKDGGRIIASARTNVSYAPGSTLAFVLEDILKKTGQKLPDNIKNSAAGRKVLTGGFTSFGKYHDALDELVRPYGYFWSIQDGQPMILQRNEVDTSTVFDIDERHGMIGSPEFGHPSTKKKAPTITVSLALYPQIRPGFLANLDTRDCKGTFKILKVKHSGDTHGENWKTTLEIRPMEAPAKGSSKSKTKASNTFSGG